MKNSSRYVDWGENMNNKINVGDKVICIVSGVTGVIIRQYIPTASEEQTMVMCTDGRKYHAPTRLFKKIG
ncbi:TPA: hypothetical protein MMJ96_000996 [Clostridium botulinum]|nr:hypothetical protein [Clostridium botulinum]